MPLCTIIKPYIVFTPRFSPPQCSLCCTKTQQLGCERNCQLPDPSDIMNKWCDSKWLLIYLNAFYKCMHINVCICMHIYIYISLIYICSIYIIITHTYLHTPADSDSEIAMERYIHHLYPFVLWQSNMAMENCWWKWRVFHGKVIKVIYNGNPGLINKPWFINYWEVFPQESWIDTYMVPSQQPSLGVYWSRVDIKWMISIAMFDFGDPSWRSSSQRSSR